MRIALICPYSRGSLRGNIITVRRITGFLRQAGLEVLAVAADSCDARDMESQLDAFKPDLLHGFNACHSGPLTRQLAERLHIPYLITLTGSDFNDPGQRNHPDTGAALNGAAAIVCFSPLDAERFGGFFPSLQGMVTVIPQGVAPLPVDSDDTFGIDPTEYVLLLPAALRPVKGVEFPLKALSQPGIDSHNLRLVFVGGVIDAEYAGTVFELLKGAPHATWLGEVGHGRMGSLYARADLVLNCSGYESMPNSLLEAMALGRPVLAADIPGNRSLITPGVTGWLYDGEADFRRFVTLIAEHPHLREEVGRNAGVFVQNSFSPQREAVGYISLYSALRGSI